MSDMPPDVRERYSNTKFIRIAPTIQYKYNNIGIIKTKLTPREFEKIPYKFILNGEDAIGSFFSAIGFCERLLDQCVGFFCHSIQEIVAITAAIKEIIPNNTHKFKYGYSKSLTLTDDQQPFQRILDKMECFETVELFANSLFPTASIWYFGDKRPRFHVVLQLWKPESNHRWNELQTCLFNNVTHPLVDKVHIFLDGDDAAEAYEEYPESLKAKLTIFPMKERLTYKFAMEYMSTLPTGDFAALVNSDIYFDDSIYNIWNVQMENRCLALLRYDVSLDYAMKKEGASEPQIFTVNGRPRTDSQDTWIFRVDDLVAHKQQESWNELTFTLGVPGCDNTIAGELMRRRWATVNPALTIKTMHVHEEPVRHYNRSQLVTLGIYVLMNATAITDA